LRWGIDHRPLRVKAATHARALREQTSPASHPFTQQPAPSPKLHSRLCPLKLRRRSEVALVAAPAFAGGMHTAAAAGVPAMALAPATGEVRTSYVKPLLNQRGQGAASGQSGHQWAFWPCECRFCECRLSGHHLGMGALLVLLITDIPQLASSLPSLASWPSAILTWPH
jgi:hypothetical protein